VPTPELSVVVASHDRPLRLRWLLNALEAQTLSRALWEVVVCQDSSGAETDELLATHPLALSGTLRSTRLPAGTAPPGANRNAAVRLASARTIVFTDDDCRPPAEWLANVRSAVARNPDAIIQGPVRGDPDEEIMRLAPFWRTLYIPTVPGAWAECANIVYPRALFEQVGGFVEDVYTGEDIELNMRAQEHGAAYVGDAGMQTYHAVYDPGLLGYMRGVERWGDLALLFKRHPSLRERLTLGLFWKQTHALLPLAVAGLLLRRRNPLWAALAIPWAVQWEPRQHGPKGRVRHLIELPGWALIDASEMVALARGSIRHRSVVL
jgi:glycosyltransferase involved in cell wall biosynthesis